MVDYRFSLSGVALPEDEDPLGLWDVPQDSAVASPEPASPETSAWGSARGSVSAGPSAPVEPVWRIELPGSPAEAQAILAGQMRAVQLAQRDLADVDLELDRLGAPGAVASPEPSARGSFSASDELAAPKMALLAAVDGLHAPVSCANWFARM